MSALEDRLLNQMREAGLPEPEREYRFSKARLFRFDFCWPSAWVAVECEGGVFNRGKHGRASGIQGDCEKGNLAARLGFCLLRYTSPQVRDGSALREITSTLKERGLIDALV